MNVISLSRQSPSSGNLPLSGLSAFSEPLHTLSQPSTGAVPIVKFELEKPISICYVPWNLCLSDGVLLVISLGQEVEIMDLDGASTFVEIEGLSVLCDPWFVGKPYYGSWSRKVPNNWQTLEPDILFVSHIHPDHYSLETIDFYLTKNPSVKIICPIFQDAPNHLRNKMARDGLAVFNESNFFEIDGVEFFCFPRDCGDRSDIDGAVFICSSGHKYGYLFLNDFKFSVSSLNHIASTIDELGKRVSICSYNYTCSGSSPHTTMRIKETDDGVLAEYDREREAIEREFIDRFNSAGEIFGPEVKMHCSAGGFFYSDHLSEFNSLRSLVKRDHPRLMRRLEIEELGNKIIVLNCACGDVGVVDRQYVEDWSEIYGGSFGFENIDSYNLDESLIALFKKKLRARVQEPSSLRVEFFVANNFADYLAAVKLDDYSLNYRRVESFGDNGSGTLQILMPQAVFAMWCQGEMHWNNLQLGCLRMIRRIHLEYMESVAFESKLNFLN